jgi:transketolase
MDKEMLKEKALEMRREIVQMITAAGSGHPGGSLSAVEILTYLYFHEMNIDPENPTKAGRDRFILSKGHAAPVLYAALALRGYFPVEELATLRKLGSKLQGHPDMRKVPGVEMSTGSLGQGLSAANGMALADKLDGQPNYVYVMVGDGEMQEGQIWEAAMAAAHYRLDKVIGFLDYNGLQIDGRLEEVMNSEPVPDKWRAFGWHVLEIDGHDFTQIAGAVAEAKKTKGKPTMIVAKTVKGKGVSFMEDQVGWHGVALKPQELEQALTELK